MNRLPSLGLALLLASACGVTVEVQTDPVSQSIPVTSLGVPVYAEVAVDLPSASQGDIEIQSISIDTTVLNRSRASTMALSLRVSTEGSPTSPFLFTEANKPAYFDKAIVVLPSKSYAPDSRTTEHLDATALQKVIGKPRIWIIVSNTVTRVGLGEALPLELRVEDLRLHAEVTKSLQRMNGAVGLTGI